MSIGVLLWQHEQTNIDSLWNTYALTIHMTWTRYSFWAPQVASQEQVFWKAQEEI